MRATNLFPQSFQEAAYVMFYDEIKFKVNERVAYELLMPCFFVAHALLVVAHVLLLCCSCLARLFRSSWKSVESNGPRRSLRTRFTYFCFSLPVPFFLFRLFAIPMALMTAAADDETATAAAAMSPAVDELIITMLQEHSFFILQRVLIFLRGFNGSLMVKNDILALYRPTR